MGRFKLIFDTCDPLIAAAVLAFHRHVSCALPGDD